MAVVQINPPGMASTDPGYISSITIRDDSGNDDVLVPNATTGQVTCDALQATNLVQAWRQFKLITG